jgi:hypothetical protein
MLCAQMSAVVPRSLRGCPSRVKGACGVAAAMPLTRHPGPASLHSPSGQHYGQATDPALHHAQHHRRHLRTQHNHAQKQQKTTTPKRSKPPTH